MILPDAGLRFVASSNRLALVNSHISARSRILLGNPRTDRLNIIYATGTQPRCPVQHSLNVITAHARARGATIVDSSRPQFRFSASIPSALHSMTGVME